MSDLRVSRGFKNIEEEFEDSLRKSFVEGSADYIAIYDRRHRFLWESAEYGKKMGWLFDEYHEFDEQDSEYRYRMTPEGKKHFGLE